MTKLLLVLLSVGTGYAQTAIFTIYAPGSIWKGAGKNAATLAIGKDHDAPSEGVVYDTDQKLALLTPGKYLTLQLPSGQHHFTTTNPDKKEKATSTVDL